MSYPWFRFYDEVVDDPKVQRLPDKLFKAWVNFMCIANKHDHECGTLPPIEDIAFKMRITVLKAEAIQSELVTAGVLEWNDGICRCHNWSGRQFQSDVSTERVKRFRERLRNVSETISPTVLDTEQIQIRTEQIQSKTAFGQFGNVKLTEAEKTKLDEKFGADGSLHRIEALSEYIAAKGKKYSSHYAVILTWDRKNGGTNGNGTGQLPVYRPDSGITPGALSDPGRDDRLRTADAVRRTLERSRGAAN